MRLTPFEQIKNSLQQSLPFNLISLLPEKWEKIGDVVTIKLPEELNQHQEMIGKAYAENLCCKTTLNQIGGIAGVYREPLVEVIYGSPCTETIHRENGIRYLLDPQKIMFSSGNMGERQRMATISKNQEIVIDLFAGIGYFTLPIAVHGTPEKVFSCEINPVAYEYLCKNMVLNQVTDIVEPLLGDNRLTAPKNCGDRVILGYLEHPELFLPTALECLRNQTGVLHYHDVVAVESIPHQPLAEIKTVAKRYHRSVELLMVTTVKSYAPSIDHVVLDVRVSQ